VVGVESVSKTEGVSQDADPHAVDPGVAGEVVGTGDDEPQQNPEPDHVQQYDDSEHAPQ